MRIVNKEDVTNPVENPLGEVIYEMIGAPEELGEAQKHSFAIVEIPPKKKSSKHYHHESEETYYILRGTAKITIDGKEFELTPGTAAFITPPEKHKIVNSGEEVLEFVVVSSPPWVIDDSVFLE